MEFKIKNEEIRQLMNIDVVSFPKYVTQILNLANQNAQATRPKVVGQMSELIREFTGKSLKEWEDWYIKKHPQAIEKSTKKILEMINNFRDVIDKIDENMIRLWVRDLVIIKTFIGLRFQEAILKKIADYFKTSFSLASPEDESKGVDGYVNKIPISIKPVTYSFKKDAL